MRVLNAHSKELLIPNVELADTYFSRLNGLMFRKQIPQDYGLIIAPCNSIHMFFMKFPIDVLFVDKENRVVDFIENIKPWRVSKVYWNASYVIELPAGKINELKMKKGDILYIEK